VVDATEAERGEPQTLEAARKRSLQIERIRSEPLADAGCEERAQ
jgi:hypothetical protein